MSYLIYNPSEKLYWNNEIGWTSISRASKFKTTTEEKPYHSRLYGIWIPENAPITDAPFEINFSDLTPDAQIRFREFIGDFNCEIDLDIFPLSTIDPYGT